MDHTAALARISDIFYSDMSDREVCGEITYILSEAGYGPHARRVSSEPASNQYRAPASCVTSA